MIPALIVFRATSKAVFDVLLLLSTGEFLVYWLLHPKWPLAYWGSDAAATLFTYTYIL